MIIFIINYNKFQWSIIKLDKGEKNLIFYFEQKHSILTRYIEIIKKDVNIEDNFDEYNILNSKLSINKISKIINDFNNCINKYLDSNEKLLKEENVININKELNETNIAINGSKKYYNDNLVNYNHLCHKFPSIIIAKLFKYKDKEFLEENLSESFKILKDEEN